MADQNITALPVTTSPASSDQLLVVGATEEKLIDYEKLADAILTKLTSKTFALDQGTKTLVAALNELNSKASKTAFNGNISRITFRSGSVGINNAYLDFWTDDGNRTTIGFYTDGVSGIQMLKNDTVVWNLKP
jgi:hypothetical protein